MPTVTLPALVVNPNRNRYGLRAPKGGCTVSGRRYRCGSFCPPYQVDNPHERPVVQVAGDSYLLEALDPSDTASAVRLTKMASGSAYTVCRHLDGHVSCECKGYEHRGVCRHASHAMVNGLLPVADQLHISVEQAPEAPIVEGVQSTPSPSHERPLTPFVAKMILDHQEDRMAAIALPLIARHRDIHESGPASPEALGWSARSAWGRMDSEDRRGFIEWCRTIVYQPGQLDGATSPEDRWESFVAECRDGSPLDLEADDYRPEPPTFEPSAEDQAEWSGLLEGEETREYEAWLDQLAAERMDDAFGHDVRETDLYPAGACT